MSFGGLLGYETAEVNGQMVNIAPGQAFKPLVFGAEYTGPGFWPRNGVYNSPPVTPSGQNSGASVSGPQGGGNGGVATGQGGGAPHPTAGSTSATGGANHFSLTKSPVLWALAFVIIGVLAIQHIHYK